MHYHLVLVVKYRRKVFDDEISARAREIFEYIAPKYGITVEEWNHDLDHVHVLFRAQPKSELCSDCGYRYEGTKDLGVREWVCPECGAWHDRDVNAAKNIRDEGRRLLLQQ